MEITRWMKIEEIVRRFPETIPVFDRYGVACLDCSAAEFDDVEHGAKVHGIDPDQLLRDLNACLAGRAA
ncbi:MAG TPA: DUF1858 domain-containing protein [Candidatus Sulfotelmatobacter sp.]|jgi:hybrid cluster-associated redox disulfide protein|nr:DUF1858 domain-containing protein [Candidatus Sulfotelmatobacter sp.]